MTESEINLIVENDREWRKYMIKRIDKLDNDFNMFKIKTFGFVTILTALLNVVSGYINR